MAHAWRLVRSYFFMFQVYASMAVIGIGLFPVALYSQTGARWVCKLYCRWVIWSARWIVGIRSEVRGTPPQDEVMIAAKHQSFFDILLIFNAVPSGKFIMKRELLFTPIIGQYGMRIGCVPVNRGKRGAAIRKMADDVAKGRGHPGQLVIYPQGTRVAPGVKVPFKSGTAVLYKQLQQDCVPVATNVGVFWPRNDTFKKPGLAVVEFLPRIDKGIERDAFMEQLEEQVETASDALMLEAGFDLDAVR
ncbi:lysophospholipid acyltransferase family protein [Thalassovita sp.]|uniref:lysophospholipid acyltransferase family protein n=1 Tax=Thalassovita sp. TaxID=1979401 RepID=UPI002880C560|nr:lysophospholipid acyltransferase family protein [Thalassovita sp.]MDF1802923.1 lysophospholipid acyltransferase family protein [Thalassovita sp.]